MRKLDHRQSRRTALKGAMAAALTMPFIKSAFAQQTTIRALMWEGYVLPDVIQAFEEKHGVKFVPTFFDGNSEAYNKLRVGGSKDFDLVQADGFWPSLYFREGLIRTLPYDSIENTAHYNATFRPDKFKILTDDKSGGQFGAPFCWGSYGITYDAQAIDPASTETIECLYDPQFSGRLTTSARFEENIALTALLVSYKSGSRDKPRPDGKPFNPYVLTDEELGEVEKILIEQKKLLLTRYQDNPTLFQLLQSGSVVAAAEFAQVYRQLLTADGGSQTGDIRHTLKMREGGLGWVDTWLVSSGVPDGAPLDLISAFINEMISPAVMKRISEASGCSTTIDLRSISTPEEQKLYLMDRTYEIEGMFMFDQPSSPEKWERVWSNMQAA